MDENHFRLEPQGEVEIDGSKAWVQYLRPIEFAQGCV